MTAANGRDALDLIEAGQRADLIFTDLIMPGGMNGVVLAREVRRLLPKIKVLLTSGYSEFSFERQDAGSSEFDLMAKPYRPADLARKVRELLDGPTGVA